ncbi:hypothetical protein CMT41_11020 [Colwellia sp. MT41]|uniref:hypothetical protein n=1 Tax=Colwellia sp. MT41 TaxID=58049 RepID=UPI000717A6E3|nr:hypothetical protein [Colwellia sp. MT41]ALO35193.1 hypothetical protein CMT41_11020 [Colwellia sp. MT41]
MDDIKYVFEKIKNSKFTSKKDFFDYIRIYFCDYINDKIEGVAQNDKELAIGYRDASTIHRLGVVGACTPKDLINSITSVVLVDLVVEMFGETQSNYKNFILRRGGRVLFIREINYSKLKA